MKKTGIILACVLILVGMMVVPGMTKGGFNEYGNNYGAHIFNGSYANNYLGRDGFPPYEGDTEAYLADNPGAANMWYWPYRDIQLVMKWNDTWLSDKDRDLDGNLDRGYPTLSTGPPWNNSAADGAWLTNHMRGSDIGVDGKEYKWTYFIKIVYPPGGAVGAEGDIDPATGGEIIWTSFVIIQQVSNDPSLDEHGLLSKVAGPAGFGAYK